MWANLLSDRRRAWTVLFATALAIAPTRPGAAQTAEQPFADLGRYFQKGDTVVVSDGDGGETPEQVRAPLLTASAVSAPPSAPAAQEQAAVDSSAPVASLSALSPRIKPGDTLSVRVTSGDEIVGTFSSASASSLTMVVNGQSREIPVNAVQQVVVPHGRNRLKLGLLIGAPFGALVGQSGCYRVDSFPHESRTGPSCGVSVLSGVAIGAGIGALIGSRIWRPAIVYATPPVAPAASVRAAANAPTSVEAGAPVISLGALSSRLLPFETIYVRTTSGEEIAGSFSRASDASLTVEVDGHTQEIPASEVQQVWRRGANRVHKGMLWGFLTGAAAMNIVFASAGAGYILPATVVGGGVGLMWGALIGAFVHERPLVYPTAAPTVRVMPVLAPGRIAVMASVQF